MRSLILALGEMAKLEQERAAEVHPPMKAMHISKRKQRRRKPNWTT